MLRVYRRIFPAVLLAPILAVLMAPAAWSATVDGLSDQQVKALDARVRERWQALSARDYTKAWEYSTPAYRRVFPKDMYTLQFSYAVERQLTDVEVLNYDAPAAVASVTVRVMSKPVKLTSEASTSLGALPVTINEKWVFVDGNWWHSASD